MKYLRELSQEELSRLGDNKYYSTEKLPERDPDVDDDDFPEKHDCGCRFGERLCYYGLYSNDKLLADLWEGSNSFRELAQRINVDILEKIERDLGIYTKSFNTSDKYELLLSGDDTSVGLDDVEDVSSSRFEGGKVNCPYGGTINIGDPSNSRRTSTLMEYEAEGLDPAIVIDFLKRRITYSNLRRHLYDCVGVSSEEKERSPQRLKRISEEFEEDVASLISDIGEFDDVQHVDAGSVRVRWKNRPDSTYLRDILDEIDKLEDRDDVVSERTEDNHRGN